MTRDEIEEKYGWQEGEREQAIAELAERERQIRSQENLEWARERAAARAETERRAAQPEPKQREATMTTSNGQWEAWVNTRIKASERAITGALCDLFGKEYRAREKAEADIAALCKELAELKYELAELRGEIKARGALEAMAERLDRIERQTTRPPLKAIGTALSA